MKRGFTSRFRRSMCAALTLVAVLALTTSCGNIWEEPDDCCEPKCEVTLQLTFENEFPLYSQTTVVHNGSSRAFSVAEKSDAKGGASYRVSGLDVVTGDEEDDDDISRATQNVKRFVINAYPINDNGTLNTSSFEHFVIDATEYDFSSVATFKLLLSFKRVRLSVWADYGDSDLGDLYYDTTDFSGISLTGDYVGNSDYRIVFAGTQDVDLTMETVGDSHPTISMHLYSPLSRFELITNDLEGFIDQVVLSRTAQLENDADLHGDARSVDLNAYLIRVRYTSFVPSVYNLFTWRPTDATTGLMFTGRIQQITDKKALVGFDYVMVNGEESSVSAVVDVYELNEDGSVGDYRGTTPVITVPLGVGQYSVVEGKFLTTQSSGSVGIDAAFDDDIYVRWN